MVEIGDVDVVVEIVVDGVVDVTCIADVVVAVVVDLAVGKIAVIDYDTHFDDGAVVDDVDVDDVGYPQSLLLLL